VLLLLLLLLLVLLLMLRLLLLLLILARLQSNRPQGIELVVGDRKSFSPSEKDYCGVMLQYPATDGSVYDYR